MKEKPKHILLVTSEFPPQPGGIGVHALHLAGALVKEGYKVSVVTDQRSDEGLEEAKFDTNLSFSVYRIKKYSIRTLMYVNRVLKVIQLLKSADYVIASGKFSLWNVAFCNGFNKRFSLAVLHGTEVNLPQGISRKLVDAALKQFDKVVAVSNYTKQLVAHLNMDVAIIPNGIDLARWQTFEKGEFALHGFPKLITVGRISERKGQVEVVKLLPELLETFPNLHYHCVGIDTEGGHVKSLVQQSGLDAHVSLHGVLEQNQLKSYLAQSDIFIMLSKPGEKGDVEGFGIAILEANALGVPAIGAYGTGVEDAILERKSGGLIHLGDAKELKKLLKNILDHKKSYKQGVEDWAKEHDWKSIVKQYTALLP
ncbi:glycosyltransferase family 4 protein [Aestuariibaculum sp. M13]|uniref:glycosyltransferase family 4 protein n=1 Tax=Aestuariibaculum sp. M13 TaxID=2967132 RepID=UPI002159F70B|nr:glycosyltransferase family 4 protein [Aestuariibaculum sp. M13]MCR8666350.1 glycosyltransferase family 4 protein [Aestuariibaculum sp. M13]